MSKIGLTPAAGMLAAMRGVVGANARGVFVEKSIVFNGRLFSIFNYGMASHKHFGEEGSVARDMRGITFDVSDEHNPVLVSLPPAKFFTYGEAGGEAPECGGSLLVMDKRDGSLVSSVLVGDEVLLKTQNSFDNEQSVRATELMHELGMAQDVVALHKAGVCVSFEYTSPKNRIVVRYADEGLRLLQVRLMDTGETIVPGEQLQSFLMERGCGAVAASVVDYFVQDARDVGGIVAAVRSRCADGVGFKFLDKLNESELWEGVVLCYLTNGHMLKVKTDQYSAIHNALDQADKPSAVFNRIVEGHLDDLLAALVEYPEKRRLVEDMNDRITSVLSGWIGAVEDLVRESRAASLTHREFVVKAKDLGPLFGCAMKVWTGKDADYLKILVANRKEHLGF